MDLYINDESILQFRNRLLEDEKSGATVQKYMRDIRAFGSYMKAGEPVNKEKVVCYKQYLIERYAPSSVNSMLASVNCFFKKMGCYEYVVKSLKIQPSAFRTRDRELSKAEYLRLVESAEKRNGKRLSMVLQTICSTGIRVSELRFITVESLKKGYAIVSLKGKTRKVLIPPKLAVMLQEYCRKLKIVRGSIFVTRNGNPLDRSNILHEMKALCEEANVDRKKVFPHNLRHLFACLYYQSEKDISRLADILGHSNINTTRIYTCVSGTEQIRRIEKLGLLLQTKKIPHNIHNVVNELPVADSKAK